MIERPRLKRTYRPWTYRIYIQIERPRSELIPTFWAYLLCPQIKRPKLAPRPKLWTCRICIQTERPRTEQSYSLRARYLTTAHLSTLMLAFRRLTSVSSFKPTRSWGFKRSFSLSAHYSEF